MRARSLLVSALSLTAVLALLAFPGRAQDVRRYLYAALPGIVGNMAYGGAGIVVFDIDNGHRFLKRVPLQLASPAAGPGGRVPGPDAITGIAAHAGTARLYVSTNRRLAAYDLVTDKLLWEQTYEGRGVDRVALSPDGTLLYAPGMSAAKWHAVRAAAGDRIATIDVPGRAHNTLFSGDGSRVYLESQGNTRVLSIADARSHTIVKQIGPFSDVVRPFTVNGRETLVFANLNNLLGFAVADLNTGQVLHRVEVPGVTAGKSPVHGIPSHGIAMTQDETEIWVTDNANNYLRVFDATVMPPTLKTSVKVRAEPGWITFGIDGSLVYPSTGDVIDARTKQVIATLVDENGVNVESEKMLQIDFTAGKPSRAGNQFGVGRNK